jgi:hypothetical protein
MVATNIDDEYFPPRWELRDGKLCSQGSDKIFIKNEGSKTDDPGYALPLINYSRQSREVEWEPLKAV